MTGNDDSQRSRPPEWSRAESNRRPPDCDSGALPTELLPQNFRGTRRDGEGERSGLDHAGPSGHHPFVPGPVSRFSTERVGFEPTVHMVNTRSPGVPIQPLSHLSQVFMPFVAAEFRYPPENTRAELYIFTLAGWLPCHNVYEKKQIALSQRRVRSDNLTETTAENNVKFTFEDPSAGIDRIRIAIERCRLRRGPCHCMPYTREGNTRFVKLHNLLQ